MVKKKTAKKKVSKKTINKKIVHKKHIDEIIPQVLEKKDAEEKMNEKKVSKKQKKNPLLQKNVLAIIAIFIVLVIIFVSVFSVVNSPCAFSKYSFSISGIPFCSNTYTPTTFFNEFSQNEMVYVSPILDEAGADQLVVNAMNLWQVILIGNDINATQLIRVRANDQIVYCYTNKGDVQTADKISLEACNQILNNNELAIVFLENGREKVVMEKNKIWIYSSRSEVIGQVNFAIIKQIFPNAQSILDIVNEKIYGIN